MQWITFFSQSGTEIVHVSERIKRLPDLIITNKPPEDYDKVHPQILSMVDRTVFLEKKPTEEEYNFIIDEFFQKDCIITLHGFLRIIPKSICDHPKVKGKIFNGHPGNIIKYPELKGKDPQLKACNLKLETSGSIIHVVTPEVDSGDIIKSSTCIIDHTSYIKTLSILHENSVNLWVDFLKERL